MNLRLRRRQPMRDLGRLAWPYFALTFAWTWLFWFLAATLRRPADTARGGLLLALGGAGPLVAALWLLYSANGRATRADFWRRALDLRRLGLRWLLITLALPMAFNALAVLTGLAMGRPLPTFERLEGYRLAPLQFLPFALFSLFFGAGAGGTGLARLCL